MRGCRGVLPTEGGIYMFCIDNERMLSNDKDYLIALEKECELQINPKALNNLAWYYFNVAIKGCSREQETEWIERAVSLLEKALQVDKNSFYIYENLGEANFDIKNLEAAQEYFRQACMIASDKNYIALNNLSVVCFELKKHTEAESMLAKALSSIIPMNIELNNNIAAQLNSIEGFKIMYNYAISLCFTEQHEKCRKYADYILDCYTNDMISIDDVDLLDIVELYYLLRDYKKVIEIFPENGYDIFSKFFGLYVSSCFQLQQSSSDFYNELVEELQEQCGCYENNQYITEENKRCLIKNLQSRMKDFEIIYQKIQQGEYYQIDCSLKLISTALLYEN